MGGASLRVVDMRCGVVQAEAVEAAKAQAQELEGELKGLKAAVICGQYLVGWDITSCKQYGWD